MQSLFFSLPPELRQIIYRMLFEPYVMDGQFQLSQNTDRSRKLMRIRPFVVRPPSYQGLLSLPLTCRKMYEYYNIAQTFYMN